LVAGQVLFRKGWIKIFFALIVIPLGIARNGFRIFTLSELGIHVDPNILNTPLHHRGGPIFFAISLIPFFLLAWLLRVWDRKGKPKKNSEPVS
jgi:exosortase/archaeosortase family protein